jgi:hypothetical protein
MKLRLYEATIYTCSYSSIRSIRICSSRYYTFDFFIHF